MNSEFEICPIADFAPLDDPRLHECMCESFLDYIVPVNLSRKQWQKMLARRGADAGLSVVALEEGEPVGMVLQALEGDLAYTVSAGLIPRVRSRGLGKELMLASFERLPKELASRARLEVIEGNRPAEALYEALGYRERRRLGIWLLKDALPEIPGIEVTVGSEASAKVLAWSDSQPSWQNDLPSLQRAGARVEWLHATIDGEVVGVAALVADEADLALLAVNPKARRRGVGRSLLAAARLRSHIDFSLKLVNGDLDSPTLPAFCAALNLPRPLVQRELELVL